MRIAVLTDTHVCAAAAAFNANLDAAIAWARAGDVDLIVHLGDVSADGVAEPAQFDFARRRFTEAEFPFRVIPGNHDIGDNPADADPTHEPLVEARSLDAYRTVFGQDRWVIEPEGWALFGLNSQLFGRNDPLEDDQFDWLARALVRTSDKPIGLFVHKPLFREAPDDDHVNPRYTPKVALRRLLDMLAPHDWRFVLSGHVHQWRQHAFGGVDHFWIPSTAFEVPDLIQETIGAKVLGCALLQLDAEGHSVKLMKPTGLRQTGFADIVAVYPQLEAILAQKRAAATR